MIRSFLRCLALAVGLVAVLLLNYDLAKTLDARAVHLTSLGDAWFIVHPESLLLLQPGIERHVAEWLWNPVIQTILEQPAWLVLAVLGALIGLAGRPLRRPSA